MTAAGVIQHAELTVRKADGTVEELVVSHGDYYRNGELVDPFDFWAEHDAASEILNWRLRREAPEDWKPGVSNGSL